MVCWCQYILPSDLALAFSDREIKNLMYLGLLKIHSKSGAVVLTTSGATLLKECFSEWLPGFSHCYREELIRRRLRISKVMATAYKADIHTFALKADDLSESPSLFLPSVTRGRGHNPWGNTRTAAVLRLGELSCAVHYVCPGIGFVMLTDELNAFSNNTVHLKGLRQTLFFAGETYGDILRELENPCTENSGRLITYASAYHTLTMPVHLLSCDETGATQLQVMSVPSYRSKLTHAALKAQFTPAPKDIPCWDGLYRGMPFVMAADMDLRRVDSAIDAARKHGHEQIAIAALEEQAKAVFFSRYRDRGLARVFALTNAALMEAGCGEVNQCATAQRPFLTEKGDVVDAPLIQAHRKIGK